MSSKKIIDLRKKRTFGAVLRKNMQVFPLREAPKRSPLRARRRRVRALSVLALLVFLSAVVYGVSLTSHLPQFSVQEVEIKGVQKIRKNLVRAYVEAQLYDGSYAFFSHTNIFLVPHVEIEQAIRSYFPRVEKAQVSRDSLLASVITVVVDEREAFARWCFSTAMSLAQAGDSSTASCYLMDRGGFIFAPASTSTSLVENPYIFYGQISSASSSASVEPVGNTYLPDGFAALSALLARLDQAGFVAHTISEGGDDMVIGLDRGFDLYLAFDDDPDTILANLQLALSSEELRGREDDLEYIDLRFGNRMYYRFKGGEQQTAE